MTIKQIQTENYQDIMQQYGVGPLLAKILVSMNYTDDEIACFFNPVDTFNFDSAVFEPIKQRILKMKERNEKVFIFGDYDCDGLCASAITVALFEKLGFKQGKDGNLGFYIPNRQTEGYGANLNIIQSAYEKGYRVLITVDNGVSAFEPLQWAKQNGMSVIVTDHHIISDNFEHDYLLHPSLLSEPYQYLCGAGVVYCLAQYMNLADERMSILAMLATIADVMSLKGINIKIIRDGLALLNDYNCCYNNISQLFDKITYPITEEDISFKIAPKINAIGRMCDIANANNVVRYLLQNNPAFIRSGAADILKINETRKALSNQQYKMAQELLNESDKANIVYLPSLHEGLLGLIASRISNSTNKVTFVFTNADGFIKGSGRSVKGLDLMQILDGFKENLNHFGGHSQACGLTFDENKLQDFKEFVNSSLENYDIQSVDEVLPLDMNDLSLQNIQEVYKYRPYGQDRRIPLLEIQIPDDAVFQKMKTDYQLKWSVKDLTFISFDNLGYSYYLGKKGIRIIGELRENNFNGKISYQIMIKQFV